jgi:phytoene synthase
MLHEAYQACERIIQHHSKTFYQAFYFLPQEQKQAVWAVYAFCRIVDDIVDESANPQQELDQFKLEFEQFKRGESLSEHPMWLALKDVFSKFDMDVKSFDEMIKGQEMDLTKKRYHTYVDLTDYCYHVASTVGLMLLPILAPETKAQLKMGAIYLGLAMQLTNVLRDIGEDLARDRIYIPQDLMDQHGYSEEALRQHEINTAYIELWESLAARAEKLYQQADTFLSYYPEHVRSTIQLASLFYADILQAVRKNKYNAFTERSYVTSERKAELLSLVRPSLIG